MSNNHPGFITKPISIVLLCSLIVLTFIGVWLKSGSLNTFRANIESLIKNELISVDPIPSATIVDAIYLLGGSQVSLNLRFRRAAELYHNGTSKRILILSRPGKTGYSRLLGRNLTNDEWAILKLEKLGIPKKNVEAIPIKEEFLGTLSEAKGISRLIKKRGYKSVILISSPYHTDRVKISFEKFLKDYDVTFYVQGSGERVRLKYLIEEFTKLKIYEYLLVS